MVDEALALEWRRWVYGRVCGTCGCRLRCWLWTGKVGEGGIWSCMSEYAGAGGWWPCVSVRGVGVGGG